MSDKSNDKVKESISSKLADIVISALTAENIQTYVLGTKKSGKARSIYDIVKDQNKKKKKKKKGEDIHSLYTSAKKKKKKNKKKKSKYWRFDD